MRQKRKKHSKLSIFLLAVLLLVGGTLIGALLYLDVSGEGTGSDGFFTLLGEFFETGGIYSVLLLIWVLFIPLLLVILLIVLLLVILLLRKKTVEFVTNGGEEVEKVKAKNGSIVELPVPEREGFVFAGWYLDEEC